MKTLRLTSLVLILLATSVFNMGLLPGQPGGTHFAQKQPSSGAPVDPSTYLSTTDHFGYTWSEVPYSWIDASSGSQVTFSSTPCDDCSAGPFSMGFAFPFYDQVQTTFYVSVNGLLVFGGMPPMASSNAPFPRDTTPNNLIAPFWDDLYVDTFSHVYYKSGTDAAGQYLAVEWSQVTRLGASQQLTFEVVLRPNGSILMAYQALSGTLNLAAIGIENSDGWDGLTYLYHQAGLAANKAVKFIAPPPGTHHKIRPVYLSNFLTGRQATFDLTITNAGTLDPGSPADIYNLVTLFDQAVPAPETWSVSLFAADGVTPLADTNADGLIDTAQINQGSSATIRVRLTAPLGAGAGAFARFRVLASSVLNETQTETSNLQGAVSAPFAQIFDDHSVGLRLRAYSEKSQLTQSIMDQFTGSSMSLVHMPTNRYVAAWEKQGSRLDPVQGQVFYADLEYIISYIGGSVHPTIYRFTNHQNDSVSTSDRSPSMAVAPNGTIGMLFTRELFDLYRGVNSNVHLALINQNGALISPSGPANLTQNPLWVGESIAPRYNSPHLVATSDNHFVGVWLEQRRTSNSEETDDVIAAVYSTTGQVIMPPTRLTTSTFTLRYFDPNVTIFKANQALISYGRYENGQEQIAFRRLSSNGVSLQGESLISGTNGSAPDAVELSSGQVLVAWTNHATDRIAYAMLDQNGQLSRNPADLPNPNLREADYVSATADSAGHVILTWMDRNWNNYLYYTLIDGVGNIITPPMFLVSSQGNSGVLTSQGGAGNAFFVGKLFLYMPVVRR